MGFSLDFNDTFSGSVENGTYEVVIDKVLPKTTNGGTEYVNFDMIIRNDFDQKFKNAHIFHSVWRSKETGKYNMKSFNTIGKACKLENGKTYKSFDELLQDFEKKVCRVTVKNETSEYSGKTYENLNVKSWAESTVPVCRHQFKSDNGSKTIDDLINSGIDIQDDDLPF